MSLDYLFTILDEETWGFRIEKMQERYESTVWRILYVNPTNTTWYESMDGDLVTAVRKAVEVLES